MKDVITVTSKGRTTLPVNIRRKLGLNEGGGVLRIEFDDTSGQLVIFKPTTIEALSERIRGYVRPGIKPLVDVDEYYQKYRSNS